ncbi:MAG: penicillin acylase family protein [Bacteroidota bacterium]
MNHFRTILSLFLLLIGLYFLNSYTIKTDKANIPPLGKFLNPITGFWKNAENNDIIKNESIQLKGLHAPVTVIYDEHMIPHIYAANEEDLYCAQGYVTARFRLWQMEIQTRAACGRVSEILGPKTLDFDRLKRRTGMKYGAEQTLAAIENNPEAKKLLAAYTDGINQYIHSLNAASYPVEYKLLNYQPKDWTNLKTALLLKAMAENLTALEYDIEHTNALNMLGKTDFNLIYRDWWDEQDPIVSKGTSFQKHINNTITNTADTLFSTNSNPIQSIENPIDREEDDYMLGSNNWAIAGAKTKSGKPILANDPHLRLSLPSIWFQIQLSCPSYNASGASLPGAPGVISGFNDHIAWGVTNAGRDIRDWYKITFKDATMNEYLVNGTYKKTHKIVEQFIIKGEADFYDTIVYTHHGPVVYDRNFSEKQAMNLALRWTAHDLSEEMLTFYKLNKSKNIQDYFEAISHYSCPAQNFVFACKDGDIAIQQQGKFPIQRKDQGVFIQDGSLTSNDWKSYIPFEDNPHMVNPTRGFVSSANQHPTDTTYPYYYTGVFEYFRNRRINTELTRMSNIQLQDVEHLQLDNFNWMASECLPAMLNKLDKSHVNAKQQAIIEQLSAWKFYNEADSKAAVYYEIWEDTLEKIMWDEFMHTKYPVRFPEKITTLHFISADQASIFYDIKKTEKVESLNDLIALSFTYASAKIASMPEQDWTTYKHTSIEHLAKIPAFSIDYVASGGNKSIVNAISKYHGPSWRMIVEMTDDIHAVAIYPGGQSGNPGSKYYDNFVSDWSQGKYYEIYHSALLNDMKKHASSILELKP